ncbi:copper transporter [Oceanimonas sp. NS1]|uniref:Phage shock protein B n=1 Tax=Oceanimonas doudoroffii TaxID=84158 RepID=G5CZH5_9GAMM|nr:MULTISPECIES: hypothetical protein [Oceanimonas]AEQ39131.1 hypothetical protein [Oceanimonas doudoroffii]MCT7654672.1 copper transporter [Oceanimonas sp. NS1]NHH99154.1 hypothetical protein [Oceanimonas sp. MB9]OXY81606.1 hypothetical protein B6S08_11615 [Oceanimonas doudoroffii]
MTLWILLALGIGLVLVLGQNRAQNELENRVEQLQAEQRRLLERITTLEKLVLEKEKRRPFEEL